MSKTTNDDKTKTLWPSVVKDIRQATWRRFSAEDTIWILLKGLRGEDSITACLATNA